jgi:hypothetical protein
LPKSADGNIIQASAEVLIAIDAASSVLTKEEVEMWIRGKAIRL